MSNIFAGVSGRVVNDTAKIFLPGGYNGVGSANFDVIGCGPNIFTGLTPINSEIPNNFNLSQNYPNPFNPVTNIKFSMPTGGLVKLVVFDILGREVVTLLNEVKPAGNYLVDFDASALSSGVYFYRLESGSFAETKKMLLVK
ncbi:MAG: T9SS type A sorting domain-containing protein [Ignavibacteria bacterium]|nr:T9SS type A sorting domain-containing protein [Ignavibacteria bacterium]